ncbi:MAG: hypothetical protein KJ000_20575 [Pirellulaceae bacterium]|nr:hypothetical protein [Pirellulaceae bacterium]
MVRQLQFAIVVCGAWLLTAPARSDDSPLPRLLDAVPTGAESISEEQTRQLESLAEELDEWASLQWWPEGQPDKIVETVGLLVDLKAGVDAALERALRLRIDLGQLPAAPSRQPTLRLYLRSMSALIDLSGRLRFRMNDVIQTAAYYLDQHPEHYDRMLDLLTERRVGIGAVVLSFMLFDPPPESGAAGFTSAEKYKTLQLINLTHQADLVPTVAAFIRAEKNPSLVVIAAELLRRLGLPQKPRPGSDPTLPQPAMLADELAGILGRIDPRQLSATLQGFQRELLTWLDERQRHGIVEDVYRLGALELRPGDWLLMRNPSPYNRFTDLSPGLFTHVGVVAAEVGPDGIRRFVIVDLPERGTTVPATTVDTYLMRTLHYFFLRHDDPEVARRMGQAAVAMIGNESQFDLTFQTRRVEALRGKPLAGQLIHTYCAGFLLICAQETSRPREEFFPIVELPAGGHTPANLAKIGLVIGEDFASPTGAIFSPRMQVVGSREPMYDPAREVQEAVYDLFADRMRDRELTPSPDLWQSLRQQLAAAAKQSPWLARALARASNVSERLDLEAAAKAATVIEILDEIAESNLEAFVAARAAVMAGPLDDAMRAKLEPAQAASIETFQSRHPELVERWAAGQLTARDLRIELVNYYVRQGQAQLDARFFSGQPDDDGAVNEDRGTGRRDRGDLDRRPAL